MTTANSAYIPGRSAIGPLRVLLAITLILPVAVFAGTGWFEYRAAIDDAERDLLRSSEVAREHATKVLDGQSQVADRVSDLVRGLNEAAISGSELSLHQDFASIVARLPQVQSVLLASRSGRPLVSALIYPVPDVTLVDRDYFKAVVGGYAGTFVSELQVGEVNRQLFFGLARPWFAPDGTLAGVIDVAVSPIFFQDFYKVLVDEADEAAASPTPGNVITLIRDDGQVLVRSPPFEGLPPKAGSNTPFFAALRANPDHGLYWSRSIIDPGATARLFAYRKVQGYPVYVVAGRSHSVIIGGWRSIVLGHLLFGIPAALALIAVTWTALQRARSEEAALGRAREEMRRRETAETALLTSQRLEAVGQMTGGVAHDFNNLLTVVLGGATLLQKRAANPDQVREIAAQMSLAARRGSEIIQQLLAFSRRQTVRPELIDAVQRLQAFAPLLERAAGEAIRVVFDLEARGAIRVDPGQFESALLNLVGNARDAMRAGGQLTIATRLVPGEVPADRGFLLVSVRDTGAGMDAQTMARVFEPFFTTKEVGAGTGLGLSQVYGFSRQAGGDVRIASVVGQGTSVEILLPLAEGAPAEPSVAASVPVHRAGGEVVLVVEDQPGVLDMAVASLHELGYVTLQATTAQAALEQLRQDQRIDVLFSDVVMPGGMNGIELSAAARRLRPGLRVLLTSGYTGQERQPDAELLSKPYDQAQLAARLRAILG